MQFHQRRSFIGLSSFEMLAMFRRGLFYAYLTIYLRHFLGLSVTATTLFATLPMIVNIMAQTFIWGRISDRFQIRRSLIILGEVLAALGTVGVWYLHRTTPSTSMAGYIIIFGLAGVELFWAMSNISWSALISDLYAEKDRGTVQGRLTSLGGIGRMAGVWVGGLFYDGLGRYYEGWGFSEGMLFFVAAGIMTISVLPLLLLPEGGTVAGKTDIPSDPVAVRGTATDITRRFWIFLIGLALINFGRNSIAIIFPQYLSAGSGPHVDSRTLSLILNTQSLSIICMGWLSGWLCRRWGAWFTVLMGTTGAMGAMFLLSAFTALPMIYVGVFLRGVGDATIMASGYEIASGLIPADRRARCFAWFNATFFLSWGLPATMIVGPLVDWMLAAGRTEDAAYRLSFTVAGTITAMGLAVLVALILLLASRRKEAMAKV